MNNLRWKEPWGGSMLPEDTGLCNRLMHWEIAYGINRANDFNFNILVEQAFWPELQYLNLPYTSIVKTDDMRDKDYMMVKEKFFKGHNPITHHMMNDMSDTKNYKLDTSKDWYADFGFDFIDEFSEYVDKTPELIRRPFQLITIDNKIVQKYIEVHTKNVVGVHIRRWPTGVYRDENDEKGFRNGEAIDWKLDHKELLNTIDTNVAGKNKPQTLEDRMSELNGWVDRKGNFKFKFTGDPIGYTAINNSSYIHVMDEMLKINPNQKFYISTDVPKNNLQIFYDKYDIVDYDTIINSSPVIKREMRRNESLEAPLGFHRYAFKNIVDLFSLAHCSFLIKFGQSTWSTFAEDYNKIPAIYPQNKFRKSDRNNYIKMLEKNE